MKAKLHKMLSGYILSLNGDIDDPYGIVNKELADDYGWYKLSLKNCQSIERGYDLDELAEGYSTMKMFIDSRATEAPTIKEIEDAEYISEIAFRDGFKKALELLGDKKFSEDDMIDCWETAHQAGRFEGKGIAERDWQTSTEYIQSLQQTEWNVEIEMICPHPEDTYVCGIQYGCDEDGCNHPNKIPLLDEDGFLILKKI